MYSSEQNGQRKTVWPHLTIIFSSYICSGRNPMCYSISAVNKRHTPLSPPFQHALKLLWNTLRVAFNNKGVSSASHDIHIYELEYR